MGVKYMDFYHNNRDDMILFVDIAVIYYARMTR